MIAGPSIHLDRDSGVPLHAQVAQQIETAILSGQIRPGARIATEVDLASELGVSRPTTRRAIQSLVDKGMLVRKRGVGTQVVHGQVRRSVELSSLYDDLLRAGKSPGTRVLSVSSVAATEEVASELGVRRGTSVWSLHRLRTVEGKPLASMRNFLPIDLVDLSGLDLEKDGLYACLRANNVHTRVAHQSISARRATAREAELLQERRGAPLLTMRRVAYDDTGRVIEIGHHAYRPDMYSFELSLVEK